jgi:hypothetical protein
MRTPITPSDELILRCRAVLARYLPPNSGVSQAEVLDDLFAILDGPEAQSIASGLGDVAELVFPIDYDAPPVPSVPKLRLVPGGRK